MLGALEYIEWVGETFGAEHTERYAGDYSGRRLNFKQGMSAIRSYEFELSRALLDILAETPGVTVYGITDTRRLEERVPTCAFTLSGKSPRQVAEELDEANIYVWDGNYYALEVTDAPGAGGFRRHGAGGTGALQHGGGDQEVWGGVGEDNRSQIKNIQNNLIECLPTICVIMALSVEDLQKPLSILRPDLPRSNHGSVYPSYPQFPAMNSLDSDLSLLEAFS